MTNLAGMHDRESVAIAPPGTWALDTVAISENPPPMIYPTSLNWIARLNWGYGSAGTLPLPSVYEAFAQKVAAYVSASSGCRRWVIGNEPSLAREWPDGQPIYPWNYAACYKLCRQAIRSLPGHQQDEVLVAGSGPWNADLKYNSNKNGDWIIYFSDVIDLCGKACDGYALHAYTHQYDVSLVTSSARMASPFQNRYYEFRTYRDYCEVIHPALRHLPVYLTECNGNGPWQAVGLMPAMLAEINDWNYANTPTIGCVTFYRYPHYDDFYIEGRNDVIAEYNNAVALGYESPVPPTPTPQPPEPEPEPTPPEPIPDTTYPTFWDERLTQRGCTLTQAAVDAGADVWRVTVGRWFDEHEAQERTNIFVRVLDADGQLAIGEPLTWFWGSGSDTKLTEHKSDPWLASMGLGADYSLDFGMTHVAPSYGLRMETPEPSDVVDGCGLGSLEQPQYTIHTAYFFEIQLVTASEPEPPIPPKPTPQAKLIWPVVGAVTQQFGVPPAAFGQAGHDGIDIGCAEGTPVLAIADGEVMYTGWDDSYGNYVRCFHPAIHSHSFVAHLSAIDVQVGQPVGQGEPLAASGTTGNSTGPHVHFELRAGNGDAYYDGVTYGYTQGRYNPVDAYVVTGSPLLPGAGR